MIVYIGDYPSFYYVRYGVAVVGYFSISCRCDLAVVVVAVAVFVIVVAVVFAFVVQFFGILITSLGNISNHF